MFVKAPFSNFPGHHPGIILVCGLLAAFQFRHRKEDNSVGSHPAAYHVFSFEVALPDALTIWLPEARVPCNMYREPCQIYLVPGAWHVVAGTVQLGPGTWYPGGLDIS